MDNRIERTLFFIEQNIAEPISLDQLADNACLSPHHFHRLFKAEVGQTPQDYVADVRMKHIAHEMIILKDKNLTDFAFDYGFSSPAAFTRAFKKQYQTSPRLFRKKNWARHRERLEHHWAKLAAGESWTPQTIKLQHMKPKRLAARRTKMDMASIETGYKSLITENKGLVSHALGIFVDHPFSGNPNKQRFYVALDENAPTDTKHDLLELSGGYYSPLSITGDLEALVETMFDSYQRDIEPSAYKVASTIFYERVKLPEHAGDFDYHRSPSTLYRKLKR